LRIVLAARLKKQANFLAPEENCRTNVWQRNSMSKTQSRTRADERHLEHCEICLAVLDSTQNILVLTAANRTSFELPVGYGERLHERLAKELGSEEEAFIAGRRWVSRAADCNLLRYVLPLRR
jgi:hypothetical protein